MAVRPNNPWRASVFELCRNLFRLTVWIVGALIVLMCAIFSLWFVSQLLWNLHHYLARVLFAEPW